MYLFFSFEKEKTGIKVACLLPGPFRTNVFDIRNQQWESLPQEKKESAGEKDYEARKWVAVLQHKLKTSGIK